MSYIRSLSSPEQLYIWRAEKVFVSWIDFKGKSNVAEVSTRSWNGLFRKIINSDIDIWHHIDPVSYGDISVRRVIYSMAQNKVISRETSDKLENQHINACACFLQKEIDKTQYDLVKEKTATEHLIELKIGNKKCYMWHVTWCYILNNARKGLNL